MIYTTSFSFHFDALLLCEILDTEMSMKIMRMILPSHAMISDDAKKIMEKCVFEFVRFITCTTSERCLHEQRESITAEDVLWVISKFGFDDYIEPLTLYLRCYREDGGGEHRSLRGEHLLKHPMVDPASYHLPRNLPLMGNGDMQGDALNGSTSQCADSEVESPEM